MIWRRAFAWTPSASGLGGGLRLEWRPLAWESASGLGGGFWLGRWPRAWEPASLGGICLCLGRRLLAWASASGLLWGLIANALSRCHRRLSRRLPGAAATSAVAISNLKFALPVLQLSKFDLAVPTLVRRDSPIARCPYRITDRMGRCRPTERTGCGRPAEWMGRCRPRPCARCGRRERRRSAHMRRRPRLELVRFWLRLEIDGHGHG